MKIEAGKLLLGKNLREFVVKHVDNDISHLQSEAASDRDASARAVTTHKNRLDAIGKIVQIKKYGLADDDERADAKIQVVGDIRQVVIETLGHRFVFEDVNDRLVFLYMF